MVYLGIQRAKAAALHCLLALRMLNLWHVTRKLTGHYYLKLTAHQQQSNMNRQIIQYAQTMLHISCNKADHATKTYSSAPGLQTHVVSCQFVSKAANTK